MAESKILSPRRLLVLCLGVGLGLFHCGGGAAAGGERLLEGGGWLLKSQHWPANQEA